MRRLLTRIGRLWSAGRVEKQAAVLVDGSQVAWVGPAPAAGDPDIVEDCDGGLLTPGLVDARTHPVYAGNRFAEIALRAQGASYPDAAAAGGGIASTVQATRAAPVNDLRAAVRERLRRWLVTGTTTVEAKTGYHHPGRRTRRGRAAAFAGPRAGAAPAVGDVPRRARRAARLAGGPG